MDPNTTIADLLAAIGEADWERVDELSEALLTWLKGHGFPPVIVGPASFGDAWHREIATTVCKLAKTRAREERFDLQNRDE